MQIEASSLFSLPDGLEMTSMAVVGNVLTIHVASTATIRNGPRLDISHNTGTSSVVVVSRLPSPAHLIAIAMILPTRRRQ